MKLTEKRLNNLEETDLEETDLDLSVRGRSIKIVDLCLGLSGLAPLRVPAESADCRKHWASCGQKAHACPLFHVGVYLEVSIIIIKLLKNRSTIYQVPPAPPKLLDDMRKKHEEFLSELDDIEDDMRKKHEISFQAPSIASAEFMLREVLDKPSPSATDKVLFSLFFFGRDLRGSFTWLRHPLVLFLRHIFHYAFYSDFLCLRFFPFDSI